MLHKKNEEVNEGKTYGMQESGNPAQVRGKTYSQEDNEGDPKMIAVLSLWRAIILDWSRRNLFKMVKSDRTSGASNRNERKFKQVTEYELH